VGSGVGQGRVSDPYELVEDAEFFLGARGVTGYVGEVGLSSILLPEPCSESDSTEIALPLPLFNGEYWEEVGLGADLGDRSYGEVGEGLLEERSPGVPGIPLHAFPAQNILYLAY